MNKTDIYELVKDKNKEFLLQYLDSTKAKIQSMNAQVDRLSIILLLIVIIYFLARNAQVTSFDLGVIQIKNFELAVIALPLVFTFLFLYFAIINSHRSEVYKAGKIIANYLFTDKLINPDNQKSSNTLVRLFLPFSMWEEIQKANQKGSKMGCVATFFTIPLIAFIILPLWFQYYSIRTLIFDYWHLGLYIKILVITNIWLILYTFYFYIKLISNHKNST